MLVAKILVVATIAYCCCFLTNASDNSTGIEDELNLRQYGPRPYPPNRRCPLCDKSVYSYCGEKLLHDACCCSTPQYYDLPGECRVADCRFLHAGSCKEHRLISNCCCSDDYRSLFKANNSNNNVNDVQQQTTPKA